MIPATLDLERVRLRPLEAGDAPAFFETYSDPQTCRYLPWTAMTELAQAEAMVERIRKLDGEGSTVSALIIRKSDGAPLGDCKLFNFNKQCGRAELGYSLARRYWSQGYMREALEGLVGHAFGALDLRRLEADIDPRNEPSGRILERLGFIREGFLRERWIVAGEVSDTALYGLLRKDFRR